MDVSRAFRVPYDLAHMHDLLILCYHAVSPSWPAALSVTPDALESQLTRLARAGYRGVRFSDALGDASGLAGSLLMAQA